MLYVAHKVIYKDSSYIVRIILRTNEFAYYEYRHSFDHTGAALTSFKFIMKIKEEEEFIVEFHVSDDLTLSLI